MLKTITLLLCSCVFSAFVTPAKAQHYFPIQPPFPGPDLQVTSLTVQNVDGNLVTFTYNLKNIGLASIDLSPLNFNIYVSNVAAFTTTTATLSSTALFSTTSLVVPSGGTYSNSASFTTTSNLDQYHYLSIYVFPRPGYNSQEINYNNNAATVDLSMALATLSVTNLSVMNVSNDNVTLWYDIRNTGNRPLYLDRFDLVTYFSQDTILNTASDIKGYSTSLTGFPKLEPNIDFQSELVTSATIDFHLYKYVLVQVSLTPGKTHPYLSNTSAIADVNLSQGFADIRIYNAQVDTVVANRLDYHIRINNAGKSTIDPTKYCVKTYLSNNNTLETATDIVVDTLYFDPSTEANGYNAFKAGRFLTPVSLYDYPYLISKIMLLPGQTDPYDDNAANDTSSWYVPLSFPNLTVDNVEITMHGDDTVNFNYTLSGPVHLEYFEYVLYFSADDVFDSLDIPGGSALMVNRDAVVSSEEPFVGFGSAGARISIDDYPYLIFQAKSNPLFYYESDYTDNQFVTYILAAILHRPIVRHTTSIYRVSQDPDNVTVQQTAAETQNTSYLLYNLSGEKIANGSFEQQQNFNTSALRNGLYILKLNNSDTNETVKFVVQH